jgi:hypothetical protein
MRVVEWGTTTHVTRRGITLHVATGSSELPPGEPGFRVDRSSFRLPSASDPVLTLGDVPFGRLARVDVAWPGWKVQAARVIDLPETIPPDPTIVALMDFVEREARNYVQGGESQ